MTDSIYTFLEDIAEHALPSYKSMLTDILRQYNEKGTLSPKQWKSVTYAASVRKIVCPDTFVEFQRKQTDLMIPAKIPEPPKPPVQQSVSRRISELFRELADLFEAAER